MFWTQYVRPLKMLCFLDIQTTLQECRDWDWRPNCNGQQTQQTWSLDCLSFKKKKTVKKSQMRKLVAKFALNRKLTKRGTNNFKLSFRLTKKKKKNNYKPKFRIFFPLSRVKIGGRHVKRRVRQLPNQLLEITLLSAEFRGHSTLPL